MNLNRSTHAHNAAAAHVCPFTVEIISRPALPLSPPSIFHSTSTNNFPSIQIDVGSIYGSVCPHLTSARLAPRERSKDSERASGAQTYLKGDLKRNRIKAVIIFSAQVPPRSEERDETNYLECIGASKAKGCRICGIGLGDV